jgi:single-stranded DNA-binding protein
MSELVTVAGLVATTPRHLVTQDGLPITSFRLAASHRKFDRALNKWIDGETNWFTVTTINPEKWFCFEFCGQVLEIPVIYFTS